MSGKNNIQLPALHKEVPCNLYDKLKPVEHSGRVTRAAAASMLNVPHVKTNYRMHSFAYMAPSQWNMAKEAIKAAVNKVQLKTLLRSSWYGP